MLFHRRKLLRVIMMAMIMAVVVMAVIMVVVVMAVIMVVIMIVAVVVLVRGAQGIAHCVASMKVPVAK
jgi:hypothetical protein